MNVSRQHEMSLHDVAHQLAPNLRIVSSSQPVPVLREHNVVALADSPEQARDAVLALESLEYDDDKLGTVVMAKAGEPTATAEGIDPEGVGRQVVPRVVVGALIGALVGSVIGGGLALLLGATAAQAAGAALGGAMMMTIFGAIWVTFAGFGGSDAYRQTFVEEVATDMTLVSLHTDDPAEADAARQTLEDCDLSAVVTCDRSGRPLR